MNQPPKLKRRLFFAFLASLLPCWVIGRSAAGSQERIQRVPDSLLCSQSLHDRLSQCTHIVDASSRITTLPAPTVEMLDDPLFNAIHDAIRAWDVAAPGECHSGALGNHTRVIFDAVMKLSVERQCVSGFHTDGALVFVDTKLFRTFQPAIPMSADSLQSGIMAEITGQIG